MTIDDISALKQAHALLKGRHLAEFIPTGKGISACYFNAVQAARRIYSENIGAFVPLFAKHEYGLNSTYFLADGIPVYFYDLKTRNPRTTPPPASCYRINLAAKSPYYVPPVPSNPISEELLEKVYRREITSNECI